MRGMFTPYPQHSSVWPKGNIPDCRRLKLIPDVVHALRDHCIMRDLLVIETKDGELWARGMKRLLLQTRLATWLAGKKGKELSPQLLGIVERVYVRLLEEAEFYHAGLEPFGTARGCHVAVE